MPNLVGIGNSQAPTNAMLGGLAYQDSVGEIDIDKIKAKTTGTAADIFVYDTRKDSDGGAWRHRTQNLSWYNEGANAFRGARKEFPAVAVIVSTSSNTIIYDGDDPNLSMWMEFSGSAGWLGGAAPAALSAKNGIITVGSNTTNQRLRLVFLLKDYCEDWATANSGGGHRASKGNFLVRNSDSPAGRTLDSTIGIVNRTINGVAMTVLPNAPIDASTGLPVPTIAIATDGGTNIINDNGTVTQGYQTIATENVDLHPDGFMTDGISGATNDSFSFYKIGTIARLASYGHRANVHNITTFLNEGTGECLFEGSGNKIAIAQSLGLLRIEETYPESFTPGNDALSFGLHNRTTSSYNTGWMHGAIKGAFLSSIDDTNVTGEKVDLTTGEAVVGQAGNFSSISANSIVAGTTSDAIARYNTGADTTVLVVGKQYLFTLTISNYSGSLDLGVASGSGVDGTFRYTANGTYHKYITFTGGEIQLFYRNTNTATIGLTIKEVEEDRSVNDKGLQVFGTITKTAVATGAELVAYSGFSGSNYLQQPYNSDLDFGTGDFSVIGWVKKNGNNNKMFIDNRKSGNNAGFSVETNTNGTVRLRTRTHSSESLTSTSRTIGDNNWHCIAAVVSSSGTNHKIYIDGVLDANATVTAYSVSTGQNPLYLGIAGGYSAIPLDDGFLALWRVSASAPTEEQVIKMYNDEKCLFHENAKCALYGTSDAITGLAHDDTTDVLHVGTSAGRSEFQGLNRINNTTTAVTTAISASNEFVAEQ